MEFRYFQASSRREKGEEGKMRIEMGVGVKRGGWVLGEEGESRGVGKGVVGESEGGWVGAPGGGGRGGSRGKWGCQKRGGRGEQGLDGVLINN